MYLHISPPRLHHRQAPESPLTEPMVPVQTREPDPLKPTLPDPQRSAWGEGGEGKDWHLVT